MAKDKTSWNAQKKELWKLKPNILMKRLQELETEKMKMELYTHMDGHMNQRCNMSMATAMSRKNVHLKDLRHKIACIKTMLHVKLQNG